MKPKKFYKTQWNFQDRSKDADALIYRHTTLEMIDFAKKYHKQQLLIHSVVDSLCQCDPDKKNWTERRLNECCDCFKPLSKD